MTEAGNLKKESKKDGKKASRRSRTKEKRKERKKERKLWRLLADLLMAAAAAALNPRVLSVRCIIFFSASGKENDGNRSASVGREIIHYAFSVWYTTFCTIEA